jgi:hypothetical protein
LIPGPPSEPPPHCAGLLVRHPQPVQGARREQLRERPGIKPVGLRARLPDPGVARMDDEDLTDVRFDNPRDLPGVASDLEHHPIACAEALREQLKRLRRHLDPPSRPDLASLDDRDLAEIAMHV